MVYAWVMEHAFSPKNVGVATVMWFKLVVEEVIKISTPPCRYQVGLEA
jgi:hypothetical protein